MKKGLVIFTILMFFILIIGVVYLPPSFKYNDTTSFKKTCHINLSMMPDCPLCPSLNLINCLLFYENSDNILIPVSFILIEKDNLSDQGFVRLIFHPPTII